MFVIGGMGAGKSCLLNKLNFLINQYVQNGRKNARNLKLTDGVMFNSKLFKSAKGLKSMTTKLQIEKPGLNVLLVDGPGYNDPCGCGQGVLWNNLVKEILNNSDIDVNSHGLGTFIYTKMIQPSRRIEATDVNLFNELLMLLTLNFTERMVSS